MQATENANPFGTISTVGTALNPAARTAWAVHFKTPVPQAMPADRLKARAELVRSALTSDSY